MKFPILIPILTAVLIASAAAEESPGKLVILDANGVSNLGIETETVTADTFRETGFAVGRIEEVPRNHGVLSSRIAGRIVEILAYEGDVVKKGDVLVRVESRQPGNPPPVIDLKAPIGGLVVESHIRIGEPVEPARELLDISDLSEVWAVARVPEHHASRLKIGSRARISLPALGSDPIEGEMLRFGTAADREGGTIDAIFKVANEDLRMRPGMRAEFEVVLSTREDVMSIPKDALQGDPSARFVFVKDYDLPNAFVKAPVAVGEVSGRSVEILSGLFEGDEVVTKGGYPLSFAGGGGISLKEALDAAHGHEHNDDGSELTPGQEKEEQTSPGHAETASPLMVRFLSIACGVLAVLLILSLVLRKPSTV